MLLLPIYELTEKLLIGFAIEVFSDLVTINSPFSNDYIEPINETNFEAST